MCGGILQGCTSSKAFRSWRLCRIARGGLAKRSRKSEKCSCGLHAGTQCTAVRDTEYDIFCAGFPCQPFSTANPKRFQKDPMIDKSKDFVSISNYLRLSPHPPKAVLLIPEGGYCSSSPPLEFVLHHPEFGLHHNLRYRFVRRPSGLCCSVRLPVPRWQILWG